MEVHRMIQEILSIIMDDQNDCHCRVLKPYIWKHSGSGDYASLTNAMQDSEKIDATHLRFQFF